LFEIRPSPILAVQGLFVVAAGKHFRCASKKLSDIKNHFSLILKCLAAEIVAVNTLAAGFKKLSESRAEIFFRPP
jgi:hypothetical protein